MENNDLPIETDLDNVIDVFLKEYPASPKNKRGRRKGEAVKDENGRFNLRAFLRLAISRADIDQNDQNMSEECKQSLYSHALENGYRGRYDQFLITFRIIFKIKVDEYYSS